MKPPIILADWDEEKGPLIIDSLFPDTSDNIDDSPEVLVTRCYISAQSIFARVAFSKINFNIPMVGIKKLAIVFFDVVEDATVRGDKRPFILVIFAPLDTNYGQIDPIGEIVEPYLVQYKNDTIPNLHELQEKLEKYLESTAQPFLGGKEELPAVDSHEPTIRVRTRKNSSADASIKETIQGSSYMDLGKKMFSIRIGPWNPQELDHLRELAKKGLSSREIAQALHRTLKDVEKKLKEH